MALLYRMGTGNGSGGDLKPFIVKFTASNNDYNGQTVTMKYLGTPHAGEVVSDVSGTVVDRRLTLYPMHDGEWSITSETVDGKPLNSKITLDKWQEYNFTLEVGLDFQEWLTKGRVTQTFASLDDVLADEKTVRQLMTVHGSVDYLVTALSNDTDTAQTILDNDICAKWINISDYAFDMLEADANVKALMDSIGLYGYGELIEDGGVMKPKGLVPVMTDNNAPYGTALRSTIDGNQSKFEAFYAFDNNDSTYWAANSGATNQYIGYEFAQPVCVKRLYFKCSDNTVRLNKFILQGSNDGFTTKTDIETFENNSVENTFNVNNNDYYKSYRIYGTNDGSGYLKLVTLQFYGRYESNYSEKEFAEYSNVKYIYDHGVELVPLTKTATSVLANIDRDSATVLRATAGIKATNSDKIVRGSGSSTFTNTTNPFNWYLDISSLNGVLSTGFSQVADTEDISCWLE